MSISPQSLSDVRTLAEQSLGDNEASQHFLEALGVTPEAFTGLDEDAQRRCLQQRQSDEREGQAYSASPTIKMDQVFADAPGEQGAAWSRVCDEENRLASYLAQHGEGVAVVREGDAWYLEMTQGQQLVLMHGEVLVGCVVNAVSRFQMGQDRVDLEVDDLYAYSTLVGGVADALQAGNGLLALKKGDQELFLQPLGKQDHVMKADDSLCPGM